MILGLRTLAAKPFRQFKSKHDMDGATTSTFVRLYPLTLEEIYSSYQGADVNPIRPPRNAYIIEFLVLFLSRKCNRRLTRTFGMNPRDAEITRSCSFDYARVR